MVANFVNTLEARAEEIARSISTEMGKLLAEAGGEAMKAVVEARAAVARANAPIGEVFGSQIAGTVSYSTRRPSGVILGITHGISHPARQCARRYLRWSMAMRLSLSLRV